MHKKYLSILTTVAMVVGLLALAAPAQATHTSPDELSLFMPIDDYTDKDQLSDQFDGQDSLAHLTAVASSDADNVTFFVCPDGQAPYQAASATTVQRNPGCDVIGTDNEGQQPSELDIHGDPTSDEAYEVFWNIPQELDGETVDIFALACQGTANTSDNDPNDTVPDNCIQDGENNIYLEDSSDEDDLIAGEIAGICTAPGSENTVNDPNNPGAQNNECFETVSGTGIPMNDRPFDENLAIHGGIIPNDGFTLRFTTSPDVDQAGACLAWTANAGSGVPSCGSTEEATLEQEFTTYKQWVVAFDDGDVPDDEEIDLAIFGSPEALTGISVDECASGAFSGMTNDFFGGPAICVFDEHYVVSTEREATDLVLSFDEDDDSTYEEDCSDPTTEATNQLGDEHAVYMCATDQFGDPFPLSPSTEDFTLESAGPEGSELSDCGLGTGHDHDDDGRVEHCHYDETETTTGNDGFEYFEAEVDNYSTTGGPTAAPGDQTLTGCVDPEAFGGTVANPPANHGCADDNAATTASIVKHWQTAPQQVRLVFSDGTPSPADCLTGDTSRENQVGDTDDLLVCTFDNNGNPASTEPAGSGRLQWFISPSGGGEVTATRFNPNPPNETGPDGTAIATIESFRAGNDIIQVCLQNDPGGNAGAGCSSVQKRVVQNTGVAACNDGQDNDGDGKTDYPADPGCTSANDTSEVDGGGGGTPTRHDRTTKILGFKHIKLPGKNKRALRVKAEVNAPTKAECEQGVPVEVQIKLSGEWLTRKTGTTNDNSVAKVLIRDVPAKYRSKAPKLLIEDASAGSSDLCRKAVSGAKRHRHR